jgi:hypothetical protein
MHNSALEAKVAAFNLAGQYAAKFQTELRVIFAPFVGKKVLTQSGLVAKLKPLVEAIESRVIGIKDSVVTPRIPNIRFWREPSNYSLTFCVDVWQAWENNEGRFGKRNGGTYAKLSIYIGNFDGYDLKELIPAQTWRTDYTAQEIRDKREKLSETQDAYRAARSALGEFGEHDNF